MGSRDCVRVVANPALFLLNSFGGGADLASSEVEESRAQVTDTMITAAQLATSDAKKPTANALD